MLPARDNPFSSDRVLRLRYQLDAAEWTRLHAKLSRQRYRGALVGHHGSGKTTLLEDLAAHLARTGWQPRWVRLSTENRGLPRDFQRSFGPRDFVLLDGAEQLGLLAWWQFRARTRRAGGLVITTHQLGRLPLLRHCTTSPELLQALVARLSSPLSLDEARALHRRHRGNLREALRELYDTASLSTGCVQS